MPRLLRYTADFETNNFEHDCRVWGYGIFGIDTKKFYYGNSIDTFYNWVIRQENAALYFHNAKFDMEFLWYKLFAEGWTHVEKRTGGGKEFKTLISDTKVVYSIVLYYNKSHTTHIHDSYNIIHLSVDDCAKAYNLPIKKGSIDYNLYRPEGWEITEEEKEYIRNDVEIMARCLAMMFDQGLNKITQASNSMHDYKKTMGEKFFKYWFPVLKNDEEGFIDIDAFCRRAYKGGYTYLNPIHKNKDMGEGSVYDVNSMYPWVLATKMLPFGHPVYYKGEYEQDKKYPLYIQKIECSFELKENKLPTIQIKNNKAYFMPTEYLENSNNEIVELYLTNIDLKIFKEHYEVDNYHAIEGYKFMASDKMFKKYIEKWNDVKEQAGKDGNKGLRSIAKTMNNSLYGKFGTNSRASVKIPYMHENGLVKYRTEEQEKKTVYVPVAAFVTAYARENLITAAQDNYHRFIYSDTDSLHLLGTELPELDIHPEKLGCYAHEDNFTRARFLKQKCYGEEIDGVFIVKFASMPPRVQKRVTWENMHYNKVFTIHDGDGKLQPIHVKGGIVLKDQEFTIKMA